MILFAMGGGTLDDDGKGSLRYLSSAGFILCGGGGGGAFLLTGDGAEGSGLSESVLRSVAERLVGRGRSPGESRGS